MLELPARTAIECYALAGFDFVVLDLGHSAVDLGLLSLLIATCDSAEAPATPPTGGIPSGPCNR